MRTLAFRQLERVSVVDVTGVDAATIVHNLTTNEVKSLQPGEGRETFVTDVRGKTLGHVHLFREHDRLRMIGPRGQSAAIAEHVDRYTIREDATAVVRDDDFVAFVLPQPIAKVVCADLDAAGPLRSSECQIGEIRSDAYATRWLGNGTVVLLVPRGDADQVDDALANGGGDAWCRGDDASFHHARIAAGYPWYGIDLDATNLPQEADRDDLAISFTKGCYLGQETVARLDALGQVQKKLVGWSISGGLPPAGTTLLSGEKTVGRLTSVTPDDQGGALAIGFARRSHFDPGATATGLIESTGAALTATVR